MTRLPRPTGKKLIRALQGVGFEIKRTRGSHHFLEHADGRATVIPSHSGETIGPGLMGKILRDLEMDREELASLL